MSNKIYNVPKLSDLTSRSLHINPKYKKNINTVYNSDNTETSRFFSKHGKEKGNKIIENLKKTNENKEMLNAIKTNLSNLGFTNTETNRTLATLNKNIDEILMKKNVNNTTYQALNNAKNSLFSNVSKENAIIKYKEILSLPYSLKYYKTFVKKFKDQIEDILFIEAARHHKIDLIRWAHNDYKLHLGRMKLNAVIAAAESGCIDCLVFARAQGMHLLTSYEPTDMAAENNHLDCLQYLVRVGCPYQKRHIINKARQKGFTDIADWMETQKSY